MKADKHQIHHVNSIITLFTVYLNGRFAVHTESPSSTMSFGRKGYRVVV